MNHLDLNDNLPWGLCSLCLERMTQGAAYEVLTLPAGQQLVHAYCPHREAGATLLICPSRPKRWRILTPIDAIEWIKFLEIQARMYAGALSIIDSTAAEK